MGDNAAKQMAMYEIYPENVSSDEENVKITPKKKQ